MDGWRLPWFSKKLRYKPGNDYYEKFDERMHLLATMLALYPFTDIEELSKEFMLSNGHIKQLAQFYHVRKSDEKRSEINKKNWLSTPKSRAYFFVKLKEND